MSSGMEVLKRKNYRSKKGQIELKVVMVGDAHVGKTCLVLRYMDRQYVDSISTIGASFVLKTWGIHDIAIWDTAGEEKYAGLSTFYYRNASAAILTFDMFDRHSFRNLNERYIPILNDVSKTELNVIVATKKDLLDTDDREISEEQGIAFAKQSNPSMDFSKYAVPYFETSALTGENVDEVFEYVFKYFFCREAPHSSVLTSENGVNLEKPTSKNEIRCCF